jgi:DME family drug/metabolite transporter
VAAPSRSTPVAAERGAPQRQVLSKDTTLRADDYQTRPGGIVDRRLGLLFVALSALVFGSLGVTTKGVFNVAATNALSITLLRAIVALPTSLAICALILGKRMFRIARRDLGVMVLAGLMMVLYQVAFVYAITFSNVTIAALIALCTVPVCAAILSRALLGETLRPSTLLALVCAILGVTLLVGLDRFAEGGASPWIGVGFALVSALSYGLFQVCGRALANRYHPMQTLSVFFFVAVLALLPITVANGFVTAYPLKGWLLLAHLGFGVSVLGYALLVLGLRTTPVTLATIVALLEPLTSALLAWLLLGERLGALGLLGAALLLSAMVIVFRTTGTTTTDLAAT